MIVALLVPLSPKVLAFSGSGAGSSGDPYQITTCAEWLEMSSGLSAHYKLMNDLDCTGTSYTPIGSSSTPFTGTLDGQGYAIAHADITSGSANTGLFGYTSGATISNLEIDDATVSGTSDVGAFVGDALNSTFTNIRAALVDVTGSSDSVGGLVGVLGSSELDTSSYELGTVTGSGDMTGGLVGNAAGGSYMSDDFSNGDISGNTRVGGVVGKEGSGPTIIINTYSNMTMTAASSISGGLAGEVASGSFYNESFAAVDMSAASETTTGALFGMQNGSVGTIYFDQTAEHRSSCAGSGPVSGCFAVNTTGSDPSYFFDNHANEPLVDWSFGAGNTWHQEIDDYPTLTPLQDPQQECYESTVTAMSVTAHCDDIPYGWGVTTWQAEYQANGASTWTPLTLADDHEALVTVNQLNPNTEYHVAFRFTNDWGTSTWGYVIATTTASTDRDGDGIPDTVELAAPNNGDANDDGIKDVFQDTVGSYVDNVTGHYAALAVNQSSGCTIAAADSQAASKQDGGNSYPLGLMNFTLHCTAHAATATVTQYYYGESLSKGTVRKYNPNTGTYSTVNGATVSKTTIGGQNVTKISYKITDGSSLDTDGTANGTIIDPTGLAVKPVAPDTGFAPASTTLRTPTIVFSLAMLSLVAGTVRLERRRDR